MVQLWSSVPTVILQGWRSRVLQSYCWVLGLDYPKT